MPERRGRKWLFKNQQHHDVHFTAGVGNVPASQAINTHRRMDQALASLCSVQELPYQRQRIDKLRIKVKWAGGSSSSTKNSMRHLIDVYKSCRIGFINIKLHGSGFPSPSVEFRRIIEEWG